MSAKQWDRIWTVAKYIIRNREMHDQSGWIYSLNPDIWPEAKPDPEGVTPYCGTTACFAGWAALFYGDYDPSKFESAAEVLQKVFEVYEPEDPVPVEGSRDYPYNYEPDTGIFAYARRALGLDYVEAFTLFFSPNLPEVLCQLAGWALMDDVEIPAEINECLDPYLEEIAAKDGF